MHNITLNYVAVGSYEFISGTFVQKALSVPISVP
jgi:hypothetical protein